MKEPKLLGIKTKFVCKSPCPSVCSAAMWDGKDICCVAERECGDKDIMVDER